MKKIFTIIGALLSNTLMLHAQITFEKSYGPTFFQEGRSVKQTPDGGYIISGSHALIKTNDSGTVEWTKPYPGDFVNITADSNYILLQNNGDIFFTKVNQMGDTIWSTMYDAGLWARVGYYIEETNDGGYIVSGRFQDFAGSGMMLLKLDNLGVATWRRTYKDPTSAAWAYGHEVHQTADGGYIMGGYTAMNAYDSTHHQDAFIVKTDSIGNPQWEKNVGGGATEEYLYSLIQTVNGGYLLAGNQFDSATGVQNMYLLKLNALGDSIWSKTYGGVDGGNFNSAYETNDFGYILTGYTNINSSVVRKDIEVRKVDSNGNTQWSKQFGAAEHDEGYEIQQTTDDGYIVTGYRNKNHIGNQGDVYLLKLNEAGELVFPTLIAETEAINNIKIYPNPSKGQLYIESDIANSNIRIYNIEGKEIYRKKLVAGRNKLSLEALSNGTYMYQVFRDSNIIKQGKVLLK